MFMLKIRQLMITSLMIYSLNSVLINSSFAEEKQAPPAAPAAAEEAFKHFPAIVDGNFVAQYAAPDKAKEAVIIDSRPARKFKEGNIPASINIPESLFEEMADRLPKDKNTILIFYCGGIKCPLSHKSAFAAEKLGYTNIKVYAAGYPDWVARSKK